MNSTQEIANTIVKLTSEKGITVKDMLQNCELGKDAVYNMKRGREPLARTLMTIAMYLEVSVEYLMGVTDDPVPPKRKAR